MRRIQVKVSEELYQVVSDYGNAAGLSRSAVCGLLLEQAKPAFVEMKKALVIAQDSSAAALRTISGELDKASDAINQMQLDIKSDTKVRKAG